jgi:phosphatidate cytidylyltransferase
MSERRAVTGHVITGAVLGAAAIVAFVAGRKPVSILIAVVGVFAYVELRNLIVPSGRIPTFVLGAAGVLGSLWAGYADRLDLLPWITAGLVLGLLTLWVIVGEATGRHGGAVEDAAGTLFAAATVGVLGAHILLIGSLPRVGHRGLLAFGLMVLLNDAFAFFGGRVFGRHRLSSELSPSKTAEGALAGFVVSVLVGVIAGFALRPPFDPRSGLALGAAMGVLAPVGDLAFSAVKRGVGRKESGPTFGPLGGALDAVDALFFCAPAFYWAFRTIAL